MADYIRREDYCEENCGKENREGYKTCTNCGMLNVPSADVQPVDRWISVKNKFPNDRERVIVCTVDKMVLEMKFDKRHERWGRLDIDGMHWFGKSFVTRWMPLPEPPKDGDTND